MMTLPSGVRLLLAVTLSSAALVAATPPDAKRESAPRGPRIQFSETTFNFGTVIASEVVRHDFIVTNTGTEMLVVSDVQPACGCTMADPWDREIPPGKTGRIPVQLNPANFEGKITKTIAVTSNDSTQTSHTLEITATVWRPIEIQPAYVYFTPIEGENSAEAKIVRITSNLDEPLTLEAPESGNPALKYEIKTLQPGKQFEVRIRHEGDVNNVAPQTPITIRTSSPQFPLISISATVLPQPAFAIGPPQIILPAGKADEPQERSISIRNNTRGPVKLLEPTVQAKGVTATLTEAQPGKVFTLTVVFPAEFVARPGLELTLQTSHPKHPVIKIPIKQSAGPTARVPGALPVSSGTK